MALARPLPGIRFEVQAPPAGDVLPRMDIPAFAGFAASGPIDQPVAVEDVAQFETIFGAALPLAREAGSSTPLEAYLAPAVRAFFRNGGRRCWIVRLARGAQANRFRIPELQRIAGDGSLADAFAIARSEGSWSDGLRVKTNLVSTAFRLGGFDPVTLAADLLVLSPRAVSRGDLLRLTWPGGGPVLFLFVTTIVEVASSPPRRDFVRLRVAGDKPVWVTAPPASQSASQSAGAARRTRWVLVPQPDAAVLAATPVAEALTFDLTVQDSGQQILRLNGLGFTAEHPRYWAALPTDAALFAPDAVPAGLWSDAATPRSRFPLAAETGGRYLPTSADTLFSAEQPAEPTGRTALERDGLAQLDAGLFLDPALADATVRDLLERADFIRYQSSAPRPLTGIHAALGIDEATLIAVPDAVHRGWLREPPPPFAPPLASPPGTPPGGGGFLDCDAGRPVEALVLSATAPENGTFDLFWAADPSDATDTLQEATRPDFSDAAVISSGAPGRVTLYGRAAGDYYYRVRRQRGARTGDWSNGVGVRVAAAMDWTSVAPADYDDAMLVAVHDALVTLCAARGDLLAILSLPAHYDERQAIAHPSRLALASRVRSYGALWHPWLMLRDGPDGDAAPLKTIPPDGATAGVIAARSIGRGAWIAPANEPLRGPVALAPPLAAELRQMLQDAAVNVIRQEPAGFVCLDADTLSPDDEVRPINVRRLIALVRRFALRVGESYVFEPNDGAARRAVRRAFESMLETLFFRGAFAGATERTAFQVITDDSLNTPASIDAGRLIAEIRIAPSRPLSFLTIRLVQDGGATAVQEAGA
ncbi:MAG TPA: phage tail sheath C-terminal domain-containing protein [Thermoanaerobaculia bacterium]|jgi:hypothetical protein|nr:phage tail sheath C-terminal domain-containing protein [Thermoanaerobaculia bacterium]